MCLDVLWTGHQVPSEECKAVVGLLLSCLVYLGISGKFVSDTHCCEIFFVDLVEGLDRCFPPCDNVEPHTCLG